MRRRPVLVDALAAVLLCALDLVLSWDVDRSSGVAGGWATPVYAAAGFAALMWRRRHPGWVLGVLIAHAVGAWWLSHGYTPTLGVWFALYTLAARRRLDVAVIGLVGAAVPTAFNVADVVAKQPASGRTEALILTALMATSFNVGVFAVGRWTNWSTRQRDIAALSAAAAATAAERTRITRELHDIVAHSVTLMVLQAGGAARLLETDPARARTALQHVDDLGQQAVVELRRMLGLLTTGPDDAADAPDTCAGLTDMQRVVDLSSAAGLNVGLRVTGEPVPLDAGVDVSACRIVQEALTNAARYADHRHPVLVDLEWRADSVRIAVVNRTAPGRRGGGTLSMGRGLIIMRERANAIGADLTAAPTPDGRFAVNVTIPTSRAGANAPEAIERDLLAGTKGPAGDG